MSTSVASSFADGTTFLLVLLVSSTGGLLSSVVPTVERTMSCETSSGVGASSGATASISVDCMTPNGPSAGKSMD
ncbi:hypothetical protein EDD16DRAFT_1658756 [Pisolithus croceorrhizus]|nr:hypothetical protein EDD16DRAFT_1658756 [Pisolithus croceorrhizus]